MGHGSMIKANDYKTSTIQVNGSTVAVGAAATTNTRTVQDCAYKHTREAKVWQLQRLIGSLCKQRASARFRFDRTLFSILHNDTKQKKSMLQCKNVILAD